MKKNALLIIASLITIYLGSTTILDLYAQSKLKAAKAEEDNQTQTFQLSAEDLSELEFSIEGQDLTKPYDDQLKISRPSEMNFLLISREKLFSNNVFGSSFENADSVFHKIGSPTRQKSVIKNNRTYIFDDLGFNLRCDDDLVIRSYMIYLNEGQADSSPKSTFKGELKVDDVLITSNSTLQQIQGEFKTDNCFGPHHCCVELDGFKLTFSFDTVTDKIINVDIKKL